MERRFHCDLHTSPHAMMVVGSSGAGGQARQPAHHRKLHRAGALRVQDDGRDAGAGPRGNVVYGDGWEGRLSDLIGWFGGWGGMDLH